MAERETYWIMLSPSTTSGTPILGERIANASPSLSSTD
jgi:hypothetical protein